METKEYKVLKCEASKFGGFNIHAEQVVTELQQGRKIHTRITKEVEVGDIVKLAGVITKQLGKNGNTYNVLVY